MRQDGFISLYIKEQQQLLLKRINNESLNSSVTNGTKHQICEGFYLFRSLCIFMELTRLPRWITQPGLILLHIFVRTPGHLHASASTWQT